MVIPPSFHYLYIFFFFSCSGPQVLKYHLTFGEMSKEVSSEC